MANTTVKSTQNRKGFTYSLTRYGKSFVQFAAETAYPVMDIGAAFGVATLPALEKGAEVIAVDLDFNHLNSILLNCPPDKLNRLSVLNLRFPDFDMPPGSIGAAYLSQILPFLNGEEIETGIKKIYDWLAPGGKIFIVSFSPYLQHCESYIPIYEEKLRLGQKWAGYIDNLPRYSYGNAIAANLPEQINHVDTCDVERVLKETGFVVENVEFFGDENNDLPDGIKYDGRERVGAIAAKI